MTVYRLVEALQLKLSNSECCKLAVNIFQGHWQMKGNLKYQEPSIE